MAQPATAPAKAAAEQSHSAIARRMAELREKAATDAGDARDAAWKWFEDLGEETGRDREGGAAKLYELFGLGVPAEGIDGQSEGILVAPLIASPVDRGLRVLTGAWMPWLGKRFDSAAG